MKIFLGSKKGQHHNYIAGIIVLFIFGFMSIFGAFYLQQLITGFTTAGYYTDPDAITAGEGFTKASRMFDPILIVIMVILLIGVGYTSYKIFSPAIFFVISLIMAGLMGFVSYFFSYVFNEIVSQPVFLATTLYFPLTLRVCGNLHWVSLAFFIVGSIALYAKRPREVELT